MRARNLDRSKVKTNVVLVSASDFSLGRGLYLAKAFSSLGLGVTIVTNRPFYASSDQSQGKLAVDFDAQVIEFRIPFAKALYRSVPGRLIIYIIFALYCFAGIVVTKTRPRILYSRGPHPFTEISCILYGIFNKRAKIISDTTDLWPDALRYVEMSSVLKYVLISVGHAVNRLVYSKVDEIVTLNDLMSQILMKRFERNVDIIHGVIDLARFRPMTKDEALKALPKIASNRLTTKFVVLYAGIIGPFQNPLVMLSLAKRVQDNDDMFFVIIGTGPLKENLKHEIKKFSLENVEILDTFPHEKMPLIYSIADVVLVPPPSHATRRIHEYFRITLPKKLIEYAACGKPILCVTPRCVASDFCLKWEAGFHVWPEDIDKAYEAISILKKNKELRERMGQNARRMAEELFSLTNAGRILESIVSRLTNASEAPQNIEKP